MTCHKIFHKWVQVNRITLFLPKGNASYMVLIQFRGTKFTVVFSLMLVY